MENVICYMSYWHVTAGGASGATTGKMNSGVFYYTRGCIRSGVEGNYIEWLLDKYKSDRSLKSECCGLFEYSCYCCFTVDSFVMMGCTDK